LVPGCTIHTEEKERDIVVLSAVMALLHDQLFHFFQLSTDELLKHVTK